MQIILIAPRLKGKLKNKKAPHRSGGRSREVISTIRWAMIHDPPQTSHMVGFKPLDFHLAYADVRVYVRSSYPTLEFLRTGENGIISAKKKDADMF
jgi:hypothetical protein